jgi:glyoxylase-like metal-dependent hydrolase (beta-lactamase superfamily II)
VSDRLQLEAALSDGAFAIDIVSEGFPGRSLQYGGLGWSTVALVRGQGHIALLDTGGHGMRRILRSRLASLGIAPDDITDVLLSHSHYDHSINWTLFGKARILIGAVELEWAVDQAWGHDLVPEFHMRELRQSRRLHVIADQDEVVPGLTAHLAPGHTPGHLVFILEGENRDVIFTADAAKNRAELTSKQAERAEDPKLSEASIQAIWSSWVRRPGTILIPGHDVPMVQEDRECQYLWQRSATIEAWYGDDLKATTLIELA